MRIPVERRTVKIYPDPTRVIARFSFYGENRSAELIKKVMNLSEQEVTNIILPLLQEFSKRHRRITGILIRHCERLKKIFSDLGIDFDSLSQYRKLLIGSYATHEYSIESSAFFNPSCVEDPDQTELVEGQKRVIISFRAVGEGHISSIAFRRAIIDNNNNITVIPAGDYIDEAEVIRNANYKKELFFTKAIEQNIAPEIIEQVKKQLDEQFEYFTLQRVIRSLTDKETDDLRKIELNKVLWLADVYHEIIFSLDTDISDRVIFPISEFERNGIEDARFVRFTEDNGKIIYYATYTAYDGIQILPKLMQTSDFYDFKVRPLYGSGAMNKNLALFPRRINGKYAMMSRIDGMNNYIMYSNNVLIWENPQLLQEPKYPWEFIQIGNCGSPIETEHGWIVITHGVGSMRRYCLGVSLLDRDDPSKEIGRLDEPILMPNEDEREGYVPNVVYSCGSIINNGKLIIPYGLADHSSSFMSVDLNALLDKLRSQRL
ncbi:MAG: glycosidase [Bacteroidetes bacterium]|nr:MAG: glycosidase [Bacteroidota bacterium]